MRRFLTINLIHQTVQNGNRDRLISSVTDFMHERTPGTQRSVR